MKDLMIDIEAMGNTSNAVMIQLAGVFFDRKTGKLGDEFCMNINEDTCKAWKFECNESAVKWWESQNQEVLRSIRSSTVDVDHAIRCFHDFYRSGGNDVNVWSHATFDFVIVQNYLNRILENKYMNYKGARDIRTLVDLSGINLNSYDWSNKTHNALDDCKFQITYCVDALNAIKKGE